MSKVRPVILCGGSGTRVWPESRESLLIGDRSTFQSIVTSSATAKSSTRRWV